MTTATQNTEPTTEQSAEPDTAAVITFEQEGKVYLRMVVVLFETLLHSFPSVEEVQQYYNDGYKAVQENTDGAYDITVEDVRHHFNTLQPRAHGDVSISTLRGFFGDGGAEVPVEEINTGRIWEAVVPLPDTPEVRAFRDGGVTLTLPEA